MTDPMSSGGAEFLANMLGDLLRMIRTDGPLQWDLALQLATSVAVGDEPDPNPDPIARIRLEELSAIAQLHVADVTGMVLTRSGMSLRLVPTTRAEWARRSLEAWRPLLERLATALGAPALEPPGTAGERGTLGQPGQPGPPGDPGQELSGMDDAEDDPQAGLAAMLGQWANAMAPAMTAMQVGSIVGHLARRALGQYDLPLPRTASEEILVVPANLDRVAAEWSLPADDLRLWLCAHEMTYHAVLSREHVARRLADLVANHAELVRPDPRDLEDLLQGIDPSTIPGLSQLLGDQGLPHGSDRPPSDELERVRAELAALSAAIAGYCEHVTATIASRLIGTHAPIGEAMRRRRVGRGQGERVAESLFGLRLDQRDVDRGEAFVNGVLERAGEQDLSRLWVDEANLPTPAEVDAPGLWLARINLDSPGAHPIDPIDPIDPDPS